MIKELASLLESSTITISLAGSGRGTIRATVSQCPKNTAVQGHLLTPLVLVGTAIELDKELPRVLTEYTEVHTEVYEQWEQQRSKILPSTTKAKVVLEEEVVPVSSKKNTIPIVTDTPRQKIGPKPVSRKSTKPEEVYDVLTDEEADLVQGL